MQTPSKEISLRTLRIYRTVSLLAVAVAVLLRTLNLFLFYETDIGYYTQGSVWPTLLRVLLILFVAAFAVLSLRIGTRVSPTPHGNRLTVIVALLVAAVFATTALWRYCVSVTALSNVSVFAFITGGLAAVYFILFAFKKALPALSLATGFGAILWFVSILGASYFDVTVTMNAPEKLVLHLACVGGMLLMLAEIRLACGASKPRFYLFSLATATLALCTSAIPSCIAAAAGILAPRALGYADLACLALGLFGIVRLICPFRYEEDEATQPEVAKVESDAGDDSEASA